MEANYRLDVRGKACPMPVISVRNKLKDFPASKDNIKRAATRAGHEVLNTEEENGSFRVYIRKK
ncbi:MAG: sulfurtransferase TusA family protein [Candidatus Freyarchaeota archaeon]